MIEQPKEILGLIPARGGSKSIPLKNIVSLSGHPLITYVIEAAQKSRTINRIVCSTDSDRIGKVCSQTGIEVMKRPDSLARDETHIIDVIIDLLKHFEEQGNCSPFAIALLQPTSPFVLPKHIDESVQMLMDDPGANSVQTITKIPHNYHAYNQRRVTDRQVGFCFPEERARCYNKQTKPDFFMFGNLIVTRTDALQDQRNVFAEPSLANEIPYHYALDVDGPNDLELAEWYLKTKKVDLSKKR